MTNGPDLLRAWIDRAKLNQRQTAALLKMSEVYVSQILSGIRTPGLDNAILIERETGIPVESWSRSAISKSSDENTDVGLEAQK